MTDKLIEQIEAARRFAELANENLTDENCRGWLGHVEPAITAFREAMKKREDTPND